MDNDKKTLKICRGLYYNMGDVEKHWGNKLPLMACEEMGELMQAISKTERNAGVIFDPEDTDHVIEEMGDVIISIGALMYRYDIYPSNILFYINKKLGEKK